MTDLLDRDQTLTKGEFAAEIGVSPGRVSQLIGEGKIFGDALVGEGRLARINVRVAREQLQATTDPAQRLGANGKVNLGSASAAAVPEQDFGELVPARRNFDAEYAEERLRQIRFANRKADEAERARRGLYVLATDAKQDMAKVAVRMLNIFEGALPDVASAMAGKFGVPQRDALHLLRGEFRRLRERGESQARAEAAGIAQLVEDLVSESD